MRQHTRSVVLTIMLMGLSAVMPAGCPEQRCGLIGACEAVPTSKG